MSHLEGVNVGVSHADTSVVFKIATSKERKIFIKNLASWGLSITNSTITVVTKITLNKNDEDNLHLYNDILYKVISADKAVDLGLTEEYVTSTGKTGTKKPKVN